MGGKRRRQRIHVYLFIALIMFLAAFGCSAGRDAAVPPEATNSVRLVKDDLEQARQFLARGDYESSLNAYKKVFEEYKGSSAAGEALFNIGLIFTHPENRNRDNQRAVESFRRVIREYPLSPRVVETGIWIGILNENMRLKQTASEAVKESARLKEIIKRSQEVDVEIEEKKRDEKR